jgi:endonuclease YncB( thermonuclease family)
MKNLTKIFSVILILCVITATLAGCNGDIIETPTDVTDATQSEATEAQKKPDVDYAASVKLDMTSNTAKQEVTVKLFVDGDTTHFNVPSSVIDTGVLKARYLAINTPESTGKIEEYGKAAATFTRSKLENATSIIIESDTDKWEADSTGGRYLAWVWYKTAEDAEYRNLNIEILQNGLALASNSGNNRYGETCLAAIAQARENKLLVYSGKPDPDFYYGSAIELTIKELRANIDSYNQMKVAFNGVITVNDNNTIYVEQYDSETDMYYGITVYLGYNLQGTGLGIVKVGNESRIVGTVTYYEAGGTWQVSGLSYRELKPNDPDNIQKISDGHEPAYKLLTPELFTEGKVEMEVTVDGEEKLKEFDFANMALATSVEMKNLTIKDIYTTTNEESSSKGAMTFTCESEGKTVYVRTAVLRDDEGNLLTADDFRDKNIDVKGFVDYYDGDYQIKVFSVKNITVNN